MIIRKKETTIGTTVPKHKELSKGTLKSILKHTQITEDEFFKYL